MRLLPVLACCLWLELTPGLHAGLHQTLEQPFPRNPDCAAFFKQLMYLRDFGPSDPSLKKDDSPQRKQCFATIAELKQKQQQGPLSADDIANLSYCLIRVRGTAAEPAKYLMEAIDLLKPASGQHPKHFAIHANLGTAFQQMGSPDELRLAMDYLGIAVELAPPEWKAFEETHLRLVRVRWLATQSRDQNAGGRSRAEPEPDHILTEDFSKKLRFVGPSGQWEVGKLATAEVEKLPNKSLALAAEHVQQLLIWMPYDAQLVWLLGELANAQGQLSAAHALFNNAGYNNPTLSRVINPRRNKLETYLHWQDVLGRSTIGAEAWLAQNIGGGLFFATPGDGAALGPWCAQTRLNLKVAGAEDIPEGGMFGGPGEGSAAANDNGPPVLLKWTTKHWLITAFGLMLILLLLGFQYREWRRRRTRKAATPT